MPFLKNSLRSITGKITLAILLALGVWGGKLYSDFSHDFEYGGTCDKAVSAAEAKKLTEERFRELQGTAQSADPNLAPGKEICTQIPLSEPYTDNSKIILYEFDCSYDPSLGEMANYKKDGAVYAVGFCGRAYFDYGYHE